MIQLCLLARSVTTQLLLRKSGPIETAHSGHVSAVMRVVFTKETLCVAWLLYILSARAASRRCTETHEHNSDNILPTFHAAPVLSQQRLL